VQTKIAPEVISVEFRSAQIRVVVDRVMDAPSWETPKPEITVWLRHEASGVTRVVKLDALTERQKRILPRDRRGVVKMRAHELEWFFGVEDTDSILESEPLPLDPVAIGWRTCPANVGIAQVISIASLRHTRVFDGEN